MGSAPTDEQVQELIKQYIKQYDFILDSIHVFWVMRDKYAKMPSGPAKWKLSDDSLAYGTKAVLPAALNWRMFGLRLNDAKVNVPLLAVGKIFDRTYLKTLEDYKIALHNAKITYNTNGIQQSGTGIIPLIIIAIVLIVGFFTADDIVKQTNNSITQQKSLVDATSKLCKEQGLSKEDCMTLLQQQQETIRTTENNKEPGFFDQIKSMVLWGGAIYLGVTFVLPAISKSKQTQQAHG